MKQTLLLFFTLVVTTMSLNDDYMDKLGTSLGLKREEVEICVNKTSVTVEDMMHFDEIMGDHLQTEFDDRALKVGCLFACLCQKKDIMTGAHMNVDKMQEIVRSKFTGRTPEALALRFRVLDTCNDQVRGKTNECEVSLKFAACLVNEVQRINNDRNDNA